jgi:hypothetical protein
VICAVSEMLELEAGDVRPARTKGNATGGGAGSVLVHV